MIIKLYFKQLTIFIICSLISFSGCSFFDAGNNDLKIVEPERDNRLIKSRWNHYNDFKEYTDQWYFDEVDCNNDYYYKHMVDSLSPYNISFLWKTSNDSILHVDAEYFYKSPQEPITYHHILRDWNYHVVSDTILLINGIEYYKTSFE